MLERTVRNMPVWSLLFLDCTLYVRIKTATLRKKRQMLFAFVFGRVTSMSKLICTVSFDKSSGLEDSAPWLGVFSLQLPVDKFALSAGKVEKNVSCLWRENKPLEGGIKEHIRVHLR